MTKKANLSWKGTSTNYSDEIQDTIIVKHSRGESGTCGKRIRKVMNSLVVVTESSNDALVKRREERRAKSFSGDRVSLSSSSSSLTSFRKLLRPTLLQKRHNVAREPALTVRFLRV